MLSPSRYGAYTPRRFFSLQYLVLALLFLGLLNLPYVLDHGTRQHVYRWGQSWKNSGDAGSLTTSGDVLVHDEWNLGEAGGQKSAETGQKYDTGGLPEGNRHQTETEVGHGDAETLNDYPHGHGGTSPKSDSSHDEQQHINRTACPDFTTSRIVITTKTGATESHDRIPILMSTSLRCFSKTIIFSDMDEIIGPHRIHDALDTIPPSAMDDNPDFELYKKQKELQDPAKIVAELKSVKGTEKENQAAWALDKYKFLHIIEKSWNKFPEMDWYLHIDADTYVVLPTLVTWLAQLDPNTEQFIGSLSAINDLNFAHGGSGMLVSKAAMRNFVVDHPGTAAKWDREMRNSCCGDWVLAQVFREYGIEVVSAWPTIQGETPARMPFDESHWCQPVSTLHHMSHEETAAMGAFESQRKDPAKPLTFKELYENPEYSIPDYRADWSNLAEDITLWNSSPEDCRTACVDDSTCFQSQYSTDGKCMLGTKSFMLGGAQEEKDGVRWESSWNRTRIEEWVGRQQCGELQWPLVGLP